MIDHSLWAELAGGAAGFVIYVATVAVTLRQSWVRSPARVAVGSALLVYVAVLGATMALGRGGNFWTLSILFWFPTLVFLMGFGAVYKSISLRILLHLLGRPGQRELYSAVLALCVEAESFEKRLDVMRENGFATLTPAGYALSDKGRRLTQVTAALQKLFAIERSG
jgi:hypothetical protein